MTIAVPYLAAMGNEPDNATAEANDATLQPADTTANNAAGANDATRRPTDSITVRRVNADEWQLVRDVRLRSLSDAPEAFSADPEETRKRPDDHWVERARKGSDGPTDAIFVAEQRLDSGGDVGVRWVGVVMGYLDPVAERVINLVSMWTDPTVQRQGVGRQLVDAWVEWAEASASDAKVDVAELWVMQHNVGAQRLYRGAGFEIVSHDQVRTDPGDACRSEFCMQRPIG